MLTLKGAASDHFLRFMAAHPDSNWARLRQALLTQHSEAGDTILAQEKLRSMKQQKGETVQAFCQRILQTADDAYPEADRTNAFIQDAMIATLIRGTSNTGIARRLVRHRPNNFEAAITAALEEQRATRQFEMRRGEEPMDIEAVETAASVKIEHAIDNLCARLSKAVVSPQVPTASVEGSKLAMLEEKIRQLEVEAVSQQHSRATNVRARASYAPGKTFRAPRNPRKERKWTEDGRPICLYCDKPGHLQKECRKKKADLAKARQPES